MANTGGDDLWEYDAPQFVDFSKPLEENAEVEKWFDTVSGQNEEENMTGNICDGVDVIEDADLSMEEEGGERRLTQSFANTPSNERGLPEASLTAKVPAKVPAKKATPSISQPGPMRATRIPSSSRRSVENKQPTRGSVENKQPTRGSVENKPSSRCSVRVDTSTPRESRSTTLKRANSMNRLPSSHAGSTPRETKPVTRESRSTTLKRTNSMNRLPSSRAGSTPKDTKPVTRAHSRGRSVGRHSRTNSTSSDTREDNGTAAKLAKLTVPATPTFMKRKPMPKQSGKEVKTAEEKEMETIAFLRNEMVKKRKIAEESRKKALIGPTSVVAHTKETTLPQEFNFKTDSRLKTHNMETRSESKEHDFTSTLRSSSNHAVPQIGRGPTKPQPFKLTESRKRKADSAEGPGNSSFHSMAETVNAFHRQTPDRFRRPRANSSDSGAPKTKIHATTGVTIPKTPNLTKGRQRAPHVHSRAEEEEREIEEMKKNQFKAHPVNHKIFESSCHGVKKVATKPTTEMAPFNLTDENRVKDLESNRSQEKDDQYEFHAKPVPKKILEGTVGLKPAQPAVLTRAKSPAFQLKHRARIPLNTSDDSANESKCVKANPVPHGGVPFQPRLKHKSTVPAPFNFEERQKLVQEKKEERLRNTSKEDEKPREFRAQLLPSPTFVTGLPMKQTKPTTKPSPFNLGTDCRGAKKAQEWSQKMEEEQRQQRLQAQFRAQASDVLVKKPFVPEKSDRPLTDISDFELNTDKRAVVRENFEMFKKAKECEIEAKKRQLEKLQQEEEKEEVARLRQDQVHKANPVKHYKSVEVLPSDKPVTCPISPKFSTDNRLRYKVKV